MVSTWPLKPPIFTLSPTVTMSSRIRKSPVMKSLTRVWAPKPRATPITPAPASRGAIFTPISESAVRPIRITSSPVVNPLTIGARVLNCAARR